jgi:hypothetical protein
MILADTSVVVDFIRTGDKNTFGARVRGKC